MVDEIRTPNSREAASSAGGSLGGDKTRSRVSIWLLLFIASFALYAATANLGLQGRDAGVCILRAVREELHFVPALALAHPLHHWLSRLVILFGLVPPHYAITWLSGLAGAATVATVYGCVTTITRRTGAGIFAAASLALAHTFWQMSTIADVYTLVAALLSLEIWLVLRAVRDRSWTSLGAACFVNGLGIANHLQAALTTPLLVILVLLFRKKGESAWLQVVVCGLLWLVGTSPYAGLVLAQIVSTGDFVGTLRSAAFGHYGGQVLSMGVSKRALLMAMLCPALNFPNLLLPAAAYGLFCAKRLQIARLAQVYIIVGLLLHALFVIRYDVGDQYTFFLPAYVFLVILGGWGWAALAQWTSTRARRIAAAIAVTLIVATPACYVVVPRVARHYGVLERFVNDRPYEDKYTRILVPWSCADRATDITISEAIRLARPNGVIIVESRWYHGYPLAYRVDTLGGEELAELALAALDSGLTAEEHSATRGMIRRAYWERRPVVLVPAEVGRIAMDAPVGRWARVGDLYVLER